MAAMQMQQEVLVLSQTLAPVGVGPTRKRHDVNARFMDPLQNTPAACQQHHLVYSSVPFCLQSLMIRR
jgi:hypothetical protein